MSSASLASPLSAVRPPRPSLFASVPDASLPPVAALPPLPASPAGGLASPAWASPTSAWASPEPPALISPRARAPLRGSSGGGSAGASGAGAGAYGPSALSMPAAAGVPPRRELAAYLALSAHAPAPSLVAPALAGEPSPHALPLPSLAASASAPAALLCASLIVLRAVRAHTG